MVRYSIKQKIHVLHSQQPFKIFTEHAKGSSVTIILLFYRGRWYSAAL